MTPRIEILPGVFLRCIRSEKFKTGSFSLNLVRPLCREEAAQNALIPSVLLRGTTQHPDIRSISMALDNLYGVSVGNIVRKKGELQTVGLYADYIEDALVGEPIFRKTVDFVGELLFQPLLQDGGFLPSAFAGEKQNLINAIRARINDKRVYAVTQMIKTMFRNEPYGVARTGEEEDLAILTPQSLYAHTQELLAGSRLELFYMGREAPERVQEAFRAMLAPLPRKALCRTEVSRRTGTIVPQSVTERLPVAQSKLCIGYRTGHIDTLKTLAQYLVFNLLFGAGTNCKLFLKVREEKSLCYSISSTFDRFQDLMVVYAGISADKREAAMEGIQTQLDACCRGDFTQDELDTAIKQLVSIQRSGLDSPSRLDDFYVGQAVVGEDGTMEELLAAAETVTREQVMQVAAGAKSDTVYFLEGDAT